MTLSAALIVAAKVALPGLLAENERLKGDIEAYRKTMAAMVEAPDAVAALCVRVEAAEAKLSALGGGEGVFICTKCNTEIALSTPANPWRPEAERLRTRFNTWLHSAFIEDRLAPSPSSHAVLAKDMADVHALLSLIAPLPTPEEDAATINQPGDRA